MVPMKLTRNKIRILLPVLLLWLGLAVSGSGTLAGTDLFDAEDYQYQDCPFSMRLRALTNVQLEPTSEADQLAVRWDPPNPATWHLPGYTAAITVILDGPGGPRKQDAALGTSHVVFEDLDPAGDWQAQVAVTDSRGWVLSDIAEDALHLGARKPAFSAPFMYRNTTTATETQVGTFYYLGFHYNFDNWYVASGRTVPLRPRFRVGLRDGVGDRPAGSDFAHFRLRVEDGNGDDVLGFDAATITDSTYQNAVFVPGQWLMSDMPAAPAAPFANIRRDRGVDPTVPASHESASSVYAHYYTDTNHPRPKIADDIDGALIRTDQLSFFTLAAKDSNRTLTAQVPDEIYDLPNDIYIPDGTYVISAWAEAANGARISPVSSVTLNVQEQFTGIGQTNMHFIRPHTSGLALASSKVLAKFPTSVTEPDRQSVEDASIPVDVQLPPPDSGHVATAHAKLDSTLNQAVAALGPSGAEAQASGNAGTTANAGATRPVMFFTQDATSTNALVEFLQNNGGSPDNQGDTYVEADVPVDLLVRAAAQAGVQSVKAIIPPKPLWGKAGGQGATVHGVVPDWRRRAAYYGGQDIRVGVIDTGFLDLQKLMGTELSSSVVARCYTARATYTSDPADCESITVHGTAVAEAVIDIAPDASLYIANPGSWSDLRQTVNWMVTQDVDIINHSVGWLWDGPGNGTSPYTNSPLGTVDVAVTGGILWVNSAGNSARETWYGTYTDSDDDGWHNFATTGVTSECNYLYFWVFADELIQLQLRWDDTWQNSTRDLELVLFYEATPGGNRTEVERSTGTTGVDTDPWRFLEYTAAASGFYCVGVTFTNRTTPNLTAPGWIQMQVWSGQLLWHPSLSGSIGNPAESANSGLLAVGGREMEYPRHH